MSQWLTTSERSPHLGHAPRRISLVLIGCGWGLANVVLMYAYGVPPFESLKARSQRIPGWVASQFEAATLATIQGPLPYRVFIPAESDSHPGPPWPLLIFLHGSGERGDDNLSQLRYLPRATLTARWRREYPGIVLAPQCPTNSSWIAELDRVEALVRQWRTDERVDRRRVYLTGLSMGGFGSWALAARQPEWFAAVVPICGGGDPVTAPRLVDIPIWAVHGDADKTVPVDESRTMVRELQRAGRRPRYSELKGVDHDSWTPTYRADHETIAWMYRQRNHRCQDCD